MRTAVGPLCAAVLLCGCQRHEWPQPVAVEGGTFIPSDPNAYSPLADVPCDGMVDDGHIGRRAQCYPRGTRLLLPPSALDFTTKGEEWRPVVHGTVHLNPQRDGSWELAVE
ncbi:MAG TPA: hypothetical protein VE987_13020 [Polyangiaceae bacterium]|nr:hypothetical protein [Polyangiaceae bacterium]